MEKSFVYANFIEPVGKHEAFQYITPHQGAESMISHLLNTTEMRENETKVQIRWMMRRDMHEVLAIENECFEFAWTEEEFVRCVRQRNCIGMVAECQGRVVGFMIYELLKTRIHLLNVATLKEFRRHGIGSQMVAKLLGKLGNSRRNRISLEVRETNLAAQLFLRSLGFRATEILKDFYDETNEDAYQMVFKPDYQTTPRSCFPCGVNRISQIVGQ